MKLQRRKKRNLYNKALTIMSWIAGAFASTLCFSLMFLIMPELAVFAGGLLAVIIFAIYEMRQRRFWEQATDFKFGRLSEGQQHIVQNLQKQRRDIDAMRNDLKDFNTTGIDDNYISQSSHKPHYYRASKSTYKSANKVSYNDLKNAKNYILNPQTMPEAIKPEKKLSPHSSNENYKPRKSFTSMHLENKRHIDQPEFSPFVIQELLDNAIRKKQINSFLQPIVNLPQRKVLAYELYTRLRARPGVYIPAAKYIDIAEQSDSLKDIDNLVLQDFLSLIRKKRSDIKNILFFLNVRPESFRNKNFMRSLLAFLSANKNFASSLVFEMMQESYTNLSKDTLKVMDGLQQLGCRFSQDHSSKHLSNLHYLMGKNIGFIKMHHLDLRLMLKSKKSAAEFIRTKSQFEANGVRIIASGIETENDLNALLDLDLSFGQGFLFGKPDVIGAYPPFSHAKQFTRRDGWKEDVA